MHLQQLLLCLTFLKPLISSMGGNAIKFLAQSWGGSEGIPQPPDLQRPGQPPGQPRGTANNTFVGNLGASLGAGEA